MRTPRGKMTGEGGEVVYHLLSRTVNGEWLIGAMGKEILRRLIWIVAEFAGLEIITYTVLSNHFHILLRVREPQPLSDEELLRRYRLLYPKPTKYQVARLEVIERLLRANGPEAVEWRRRILSLMNDASQYMKLVKERFSIWHNKNHGRFGPVWADRFTSLVVEPKDWAIATVAAYIDLNCVRAGIVKDPKDYRYCGYANAVSGDVRARRGICTAVGGDEWSQTQSRYRLRLFAAGVERREGKASISREELQEVLKQGGTLPIAEVLRCRIRYLSTGAALGSRAFVEEQLEKFRTRTGRGSRMSVRTLPQVTDWGPLAGMRQFAVPFFG